MKEEKNGNWDGMTKQQIIAESFLKRLCASQEAEASEYNCLRFYKDDYHDYDADCMRQSYRMICKQTEFLREAIFASLSKLDARCRDVLWELYINKQDPIDAASLLEIYTSEVERLRLEGLRKLDIPPEIYRQIEREYEEWLHGNSNFQRIRRMREAWRDDSEAATENGRRMDAFDSNKYLFNCQNGTLDMNTLEFRPHSPADFITKLSPVVYDPDADCPRWTRFVDEVMMGKTAVGRYLQKAVGYSLTGDTSLECLFIMYGPTTRNGKTTAIDTILKLMGEYGRSAKPDMLASNFRGPSNGAPSEDVARLAEARFVGISEMEQKLTINASLTKQLTGNNKITARFLHENSFEFHLQAKIFIDTNHLPNVNDQTLFESGRIKIIPFRRHFEDHEQGKSLKSTLTDDASLSGILNWAVEGYRLYKSEGLEPPDEVQLATAQYKQDSDRIAQFIDAWMEDGKDENGDKFEVPCKAAYRVYSSWCEEMNYRPDNYKNFRAAMEKTYTVMRKISSLPIPRTTSMWKRPPARS